MADDNVREMLLLMAASCIAQTVKTKFSDIKSLRPEQVLAITQFILRKDVFAVLPTGMGKSLIFQLIPDICARLSALGISLETDRVGCFPPCSTNFFPYTSTAIAWYICSLSVRKFC